MSCRKDVVGQVATTKMAIFPCDGRRKGGGGGGRGGVDLRCEVDSYPPRSGIILYYDGGDQAFCV